ncbi:MAG: peptidylprolyl isomerase, partial [Candidatus Eremiobacterota bacterium]
METGMRVLRLLVAAMAAFSLWACSAQAGDQPTPDAMSTPLSRATPEPATTQAAETPAATPTPAASPTPAGATTPGADRYHGLVPFPDVKAPDITEVVKIKMVTDTGELALEVYPQAAPNAAKRFVELTRMGFYNDTPIFRVVPEFVVQFGVNWRKGMVDWKENNFKDDPSLFQLLPGTLCFAKAGPNVNSTQVFINYIDTSQLREQGGFTVFGRVTRGMEVAKGWKRVGDPSYGLDQTALWMDGENYLKSLPEKPNKIVKMEVVK